MVSPEVRRTHVGRFVSEGTRSLWRELSRREWTQGDLARALDVASPTVNKWLHGTTRPGLQWALEIERVTGIKAALWGERPRRPFVLRLRARTAVPKHAAAADARAVQR